jgi:hypothetical protein
MAAASTKSISFSPFFNGYAIPKFIADLAGDRNDARFVADTNRAYVNVKVVPIVDWNHAKESISGDFVLVVGKDTDALPLGMDTHPLVAYVTDKADGNAVVAALHKAAKRAQAANTVLRELASARSYIDKSDPDAVVKTVLNCHIKARSEPLKAFVINSIDGSKESVRVTNRVENAMEDAYENVITTTEKGADVFVFVTRNATRDSVVDMEELARKANVNLIVLNISASSSSTSLPKYVITVEKPVTAGKIAVNILNGKLPTGFAWSTTSQDKSMRMRI